MTSEQLEAHVEKIKVDGYSIVEDAFDAAFADEVVGELQRLERELKIEPAANPFEGANTLRIYNLLLHGKVWEQIAEHPNVLPLVDRVLDPGCLVSSLSSVNIGPGEIAQMIHADDQLIPIPKPHVAIVCNTMWAFTDFTAENGATRIIPGSHLRDRSPKIGKEYESIPAVMKRGCVMVYHGSLWHGGGPNQTSERRIGVAMNYCAGYIRQQENQQLGLPPKLVKTFSRRLQELVGYGLYNGLIGHIDKKIPMNLLANGKSTVIWDM